MSDEVKVVRDGHVMEITLDRPKVNAIDVPTSQKLAAAFQAVSYTHLTLPTNREV